MQYGRSKINCNLCRKVFDSIKSFATTCFFASSYTLVPISSSSSLETTLPTEFKCPSLPRHVDLHDTLAERAPQLHIQHYSSLKSMFAFLGLLNAPHTHTILSLLNLCIVSHILVFENFYTPISWLSFILILH